MFHSRFEITVENRQKRFSVSRPGITRWTRKILRALGWKRAGLSLVLVNEAQFRRLHRKFLGKDQASDVLAFGQREGKFFPQPGVPFLGDVVISVERAKQVASEFGNRWDEELLLYLCHGVLHLTGYRDSTPQGKARMDAKQKEILRKVLGRTWRFKRRKPLF